MQTRTALLLLLSVMLSPLTGVAQQDSKLLPAEEAFKFHASLVNPNTIEAVWTIAEGYYMYRSKFGFTAEPVQAVPAAAPMQAVELTVENQWTDENGHTWRLMSDGSNLWWNGSDWQKV